MQESKSVSARRKLSVAAAAVVAMGGVGVVEAAPYASNVLVTGGTTVNFILNEDADSLTYSINGGPAQSLATTKGAKTFNLGSAGDTFSISAGKTAATGYNIATGGTVAAEANGLSQASNQGGLNVISNNTAALNRFNSPRGVAISNDPNSPNFGTAYISNSAASTAAIGTRAAAGDGLYALRADQSDAFGYGDTAQDPGNKFDGLGASANSPFRVTVDRAGDVYVTDFSDANGNVYRLNPNLTTSDAMLAGIGGPAALPVGQNHGSVTSVYVEGTGANRVMYTVDEDLRSSQFGGPAGDDRNSLWSYAVGNATSFAGTPTKVNQANVLLPAATSDLDRGLVDGKFYLAQNRANGGEAGLVVLNPDGTTAFDSLTASRTLLGNPTAVDILRNVQAMDVSDDQTFVALMLNISDIAVVPLVNGIPDLANRLVVDSGNVISGRDIAFDAAGNIHYVSSGQAFYSVIAPGGTTVATTSFNGSSYSFSVVPEPASIAVLAAGAGLLALRRRRSA